MENNIKINLGEACSELSTKKLIEYYHPYFPEKTEEEIEDMIMFEGDDGVLYYKKEAQDIFNTFYGEYWDLLKNISL